MINNLTEARINTHVETALPGDQAQHYDMIVFSHIEWQCIYKRPQHIVKRMSETMKVLYVEKPSYGTANKKSGNIITINEKLHVLQLHADSMESIAEIIPLFTKGTHIPVGWFYDPAFCPLLELFQFDTVVYDCVEELSSSTETQKQLIDQEKYLMASADIVFTNGKSLYELKKQSHNNVHYFPSSVDESHFSRALQNISIPTDIGDIPYPIAGYYGTIDSKIDLELLKKTAEKLPNVSFVLIGPLQKTEQIDLPQASNIYHLGTKCYDELPNYLKAFDIALLPYVANETTQYINPVKTLEYMAAQKPIVSTKNLDVSRDCTNCINVVQTPDEFAAAIRNLIQNRDPKNLEATYKKVLESTSWDITVNQMKSIIKFFAK